MCVEWPWNDLDLPEVMLHLHLLHSPGPKISSVSIYCQHNLPCLQQMPREPRFRLSMNQVWYMRCVTRNLPWHVRWHKFCLFCCTAVFKFEHSLTQVHRVTPNWPWHVWGHKYSKCTPLPLLPRWASDFLKWAIRWAVIGLPHNFAFAATNKLKNTLSLKNTTWSNMIAQLESTYRTSY